MTERIPFSSISGRSIEEEKEENIVVPSATQAPLLPDEKSNTPVPFSTLSGRGIQETTTEAPKVDPGTPVPFSTIRKSKQNTTDKKQEPKTIVKTGNGRLYNVDKIVEEYDRPLIKEDFMKDKRLQNLVIENLEARMNPDAFAGGVRRTATRLGGGVSISPLDYRSMDFEDVFETWQNYQRSFSIGQSVTVGNELAYITQANDKIKSTLGGGYKLFDSMDNAFTGEGSWREMGDAVMDYTRGAIVDPATLLSLGIGKALTSGSSKAAAVTIKQLAKSAATKGMTGKAFGAALKAAPYVAPDIVFNVGQDVAYQLTRMESGVQEDYSPFQTGVVAAGTAAIPALLAGTKALAALRKTNFAVEKTFLGYKKLANELDPLPKDEAWIKVGSRINNKTVIDGLDDQFGTIKGDFSKLQSWTETKKTARSALRNKEDYTDQELVNKFNNFFMFGSKESGHKGFTVMLKEAGFYPMRSLVDEGENLANAYTHAIKMLDDDVVEKIVKDYESTVGRKLNVGYTAEELSNNFAKNSSDLGTGLNILSRLERVAKAGGVEPDEATKLYMGAKAKIDPNSPKRIQFGLSTYKRLLTSHLATTGANLRGFGQLVSINTAADFVSAGAYAAQAIPYAMLGKKELAARYGRRAIGSLKSPIRRVADALTPDLPMAYADKVLEQVPQIQSRVFRDVSGDGGVIEPFKHFNLDESNKLWKGMDNVTKATQTITLVRMQDDLTKRWAFGSNLNSWIMKEYNVSPEKFFAKENLDELMTQPRWFDVLDRAAQDTLRETASVNWSTLPSNKAIGSARWWARQVEFTTNNTPLGFVIPFGSFLNTTIATAGDLTGVNALRQIVKSAWGTPLDYGDDEFARLVGKGVAGWTLAIYGINAAQDRIENGLSWDTIEQPTGGYTSGEFDWPASTLRLSSTIMAHALDGRRISHEGGESSIEDFRSMDLSKVPDDLWTELFKQTGGQSVRDMKDINDTLVKTFYDAKETGQWSEAALTMMGATASKVAQGFTRPLDPINVMMKLTTDDAGNPDLAQGPKAYNNALKYVNYILPESITGLKKLPQRATPTRGLDSEVTVGKQLLGNRVEKAPNLVEQVFNSAGVPTWKAVRWSGPEKVKNYMDFVISDYFQKETTQMLKNNPGYFKLPQHNKEDLLSGVQKRARERTLQFMKTAPMAKSLEAARVLATADKDKLKRIIDTLGYEGGVDEIMEEEDSLSKLQKIKFFLDNYDTMFPLVK